MNRSLARRAVVVICAVALAACSAATPQAAAPAAPPSPNTIVIDNFSYSPAALTVSAGTTVTWINHDDVPHTVTSDDQPRLLDSPVLDTDGKFSFTFNRPGTYGYYCTVHPHMTGTIIVK